MKNKLVAVLIENDSCKLICDVKSIEQNEYNKLKNEYVQEKDKKLDLENKHKAEHQVLLNVIKSNQHFIAKNIYDNFVNAGFIDYNEEFQLAFYNYVFNDKPFNFEKAPNEYLKILAKVVNCYEK